MCGRATLTVVDDELREMFGVQDVPELSPRWNIAPSMPLPIIRTPGRMELMRWGAKGHGFVNVRVETASARPENRCLVVLDGFYEWRDGDRQPFYFRRVDGKPFAVGGVIRGGEACAIVTCPAEEGVSDLHERMPQVLAKEDWTKWLAGAKPKATLGGFARYPVSRLVNSPANDDARCIEPIDAEEAAPAQRGLFDPHARK